MKLASVLGAALMLSACVTTPKGIDPGPPPKQVIVEKLVPVPVLCKVAVTKPQMDIYTVSPDAPLEEQNGALRATITQQAVYITDLVAAVLGCGGTVR